MQEKIKELKKNLIIKSLFVVLFLCVVNILMLVGWYVWGLSDSGIVFTILFSIGAFVFCNFRLFSEYGYLNSVLESTTTRGDGSIRDSDIGKRVFEVLNENQGEYFSPLKKIRQFKCFSYSIEKYDWRLELEPEFSVVFYSIILLCFLFLYTLIGRLYYYSIAIILVIFYYGDLSILPKKVFQKNEYFSSGRDIIIMKKIIAVQVLSYRKGKAVSYQLNLVLTDLTRENILCSPFLYCITALANAIASFQKIPIVTDEKELLKIYQAKALSLIKRVAKRNRTFDMSEEVK